MKYIEREKNNRLKNLRKEKEKAEKERVEMFEQWTKIQEDRHKRSLPSFLTERIDYDPIALQRSAPELFTINREESKSSTVQLDLPVSRPLEEQKKTSKVLFRPHSAG